MSKRLQFKTLAVVLITLLGLSSNVIAQTPSFQWAKSIGSSGTDDSRAVAVDPSGNVYATGYFQGTVDFDPSPATFTLTSAGNNDVFVTKFDPSGALVWAVQLGGTSLEESWGIETDATGNVYVTGRFDGVADFDPSAATATLNTVGLADVFVCKLTTAGAYVWAKSFGSTANEVANNVSVDPSGNVYVTGYVEGVADFDPSAATATAAVYGSQDAFVWKLTSAGAFVYGKVFGGSGTDYGNGIATDASGNAYISGYFAGVADLDPGAAVANYTAVGSVDAYVMKLDAVGNFVFVSTFGGTVNDVPYSIALDASGNIFISGFFGSTVDFDPGPGTFTMAASGSQDGFVAKFNPMGSLTWAKSFVGTGNSDFAYDVTVDPLGNVYTSGVYNNTCDLDPGAGTFNVTSAGLEDVFVAKLDNSGNYIYAYTFGGAQSDYCRSLAVYGTGPIFTAGFFYATSDFNPSAGVANMTSLGGAEGYVQKMGVNATSLNFDGGNDRVLLPTALSTSLSTQNKITVEAWVRPANLTGLGNVIGNYSNPTNNMQFLLRRGPSNWEFWVGNGAASNYSVVQANITPSVNVWHHLAGTWNGTVASLYLNGVLQNTTAVAFPSLGVTSNSLLMGGNSINENFGGDVDELRIWTRALCQGEIQNNMNGELTLPQTNLLAYYKFNQGVHGDNNTAFATLVDQTPSALTGTLQNFALTGTVSNWVSTGGVVNTATAAAFVSPTLAITGSTVMCSGTTVTLTAGGNVSTYTWTGGPTTANFTISPTTNTTYSVIATNSLGCVSNMATRAMSVNTTPSIAVNGYTICNGASAVITPTSSGISSFVITGGTFTVSPNTATAYSVTGTGTNGCVSSNTAVSNVVVNALPAITVNNATICSGNTAVITPTASGVSTYTITGGTFTVSPTTTTSYSVTGTGTNGCVSAAASVANVSVNTTPVVSVNSTSICSGNTATLVGNGASTYTITGGSFTMSPATTSTYAVTGTAANGCVSSNTAIGTVTVNATPSVALTSATICSGATASLTPSGAATYTISGGSFTMSPANTSSYTLLGTSSLGCVSSNTASATVVVNANPTIAATSGTICAGSSFTIVPSGASTYTISGGNAVVSPNTTTNYSVTGTSSLGCVGAAAAISTVVVNASPTVNVSSSAATICVGQSAVITATGATTYTWNNTQTTASISVSPTSTTVYTVTGTDNNGCANTATVSQNVALCTGIASTTKSEVTTVYPNPSNGSFVINFGSSDAKIISIVNNLGQVVLTSTSTSLEENFDLQGYSNGIYTVTIQSAAGVSTLRVVKQ